MTNEVKVDIEVRNRKLSYANGRSAKEYYAKPRLYFFHKDESVFENFGNRAARPKDLYKSFFPQVAKALGKEDIKVKWSRKAGCSCGCSPGFILEECHERLDVYVTLIGAPKTSDDPNELAEVESRTKQLVSTLVTEEKVSDELAYKDQFESFLERTA